jgi:hypothetical protein
MPKPIKLQAQHRPMFPLDQPITEESGRKVAAWASGGSVMGLSDSDVDALIMTMDVKTMPELEKAFGHAYTRAKGNESARRKLKANYDSMKAALAAPSP